MKKLFSLIAIFASAICYAQNPASPSNAPDTAGKKVLDSNSVIVHKDPRLDLLIKTQAQINDITSRDGRRTDKGFRLMIISTNSRDEALAAKTKVYTYFPELKAYLWYQSPYFRVKAGNFKDRKDAEEFQKRMNTYFPKGVFIMKDVIEVKPGKENEESDK
ncbi:MAG: SPOR domain-containing protein [Bacteroidetes bacterium]|nr:SPOR domain-containing protein [Bacteroidota bacterium]